MPWPWRARGGEAGTHCGLHDQEGGQRRDDPHRDCRGEGRAVEPGCPFGGDQYCRERDAGQVVRRPADQPLGARAPRDP